jgi:hypothetical protein
MNRILRLLSLALALVVTLGLVATTTAPAQARPQAQLAAQATDVGTTVFSDQDAQPPSTGTQRAGEHVKPFRPHITYMGHDYCGGWLQGPAWCLTFNKVEAGYISAVSLATATAFICAGTALITCGAAVGIAAAIQRYVDRNGVCPKSRPKMRVEYFPRPGRVECV